MFHRLAMAYQHLRYFSEKMLLPETLGVRCAPCLCMDIGIRDIKLNGNA